MERIVTGPVREMERTVTGPVRKMERTVTGPVRQTVAQSQDPYCQCHCQECLELHYNPPGRNDQDPVRQGIVPMETPFIMDNVMDDGMAACSLM